MMKYYLEKNTQWYHKKKKENCYVSIFENKTARVSAVWIALGKSIIHFHGDLLHFCSLSPSPFLICLALRLYNSFELLSDSEYFVSYFLMSFALY